MTTKPRRRWLRYLGLTLAVVLALRLGYLAWYYLRPLNPQAAATLERVLGEDRLFTLLIEQHPELKARYLRAVSEVTSRGGSDADVRTAALTLGREVAGPYIASSATRAEEAKLIAFVAALVEVLDKLAASDPAVCYGWLFGGVDDAAVARLLAPEDQERLSSAMAELIASGTGRPEEAWTQSAAVAARRVLLAHLQARHGQDFVRQIAVLKQPTAWGVDRTLVCKVAREMYRGALELPPDQGATVLRMIFGGVAQQAG